MIRIHETFETEAEALAFRKRYYRNYHPMGYGTHIAILPPNKARDHDKDVWVATGSRATSCD